MSERWTWHRKAAVVTQVEDGEITLAEALERYGLTAEELAAWQKLYSAHGMAGLRATRLQDYRGVPLRPKKPVVRRKL